jgi:hypothetical protein
VRHSRGFFGLMLVAGVLALAQAQSLEARQVQAELTQQLQREYPGVLVYTEGDQVRRVWGKPFGYGGSAIDSAQAFVNRYTDRYSARVCRLPVQQHPHRVQYGAGERAYPHATRVRLRQVHQPKLPRCRHPNPV